MLSCCIAVITVHHIPAMEFISVALLVTTDTLWARTVREPGTKRGYRNSGIDTMIARKPVDQTL